jgi:hypothetical protein
MLCAGELILSSGILPDIWQAICVYALRRQDLILFSGFLAAALQAGREALQSFKYMLCAGKLFRSSGFLPDVLQAVCVYALRWQD